MRRQDKYRNIEQANLMLENSYLKSKGLLKEEAEEKVKITTSTGHGDLVFIGQLGREEDDFYYFKPEEGGFEFIPKGGSYGLPNWVNSTKEKFDNIARLGKELPVDYQMGSAISTGGEPNRGNMYIRPLINSDTNVTIEKI